MLNAGKLSPLTAHSPSPTAFRPPDRLRSLKLLVHATTRDDDDEEDDDDDDEEEDDDDDDDADDDMK